MADGDARAAAEDYFAVHVVDEQSGRGVPLVELTLTNRARYYTDSGGYVAFQEPGLMEQEVWFGVSSWGYEGPPAAFGSRGATLHTTPGKTAEIKVHRTNIAQRLYRLTGYGSYRDTVLLGKQPPVKQPLINAMVMGQDTVETAVYQGRMIWMWGDTIRPAHPLGNFHTTGATSAAPDRLDADQGVDYDYFVERPGGFVRPMIALRQKVDFPIWVDGLMVVHDNQGRERLLARYAVTKDLRMIDSGLALFNDTSSQLEEYQRFDGNPQLRLAPSGHPFRARAGGKEYYYFPAPYPLVRVENDFAHTVDLSAYEGFTCLKEGSVFNGKRSMVERNAQGNPAWRWRRRADPVGPEKADELIAAGLIQREETPFQMREADSGKPIRVARGSVAWNPFLKRWTMLFGQAGGDSFLGEVWLATADAPEGPWREAVKVATHAKKGNNNDFYNPMQHPELAKEGGKVLYFEGTFVTTFSGNPAPTPLYDYNQLMYRLDLSDPRINLPAPPAGLSQSLPSLLGP